MISLSEIRAFYPPHLQVQGAFILREYLQYKILEILFQSEYANQFAFIGGTCLRIVHNNQRFSEDLDFDNFDLTEEDFLLVSQIIKKGLEEQNLETEIKNVLRGAFHCYIKFPNLLYDSGLSGHQEAKILINLDTEPQAFEFEPQNHFLNKFDVFTSIKTTPIDLLLSQKFLAITHRKRPKGRDFFDVVFLLSKTKPNYDFLAQKLNITTPKQLKKHLIEVCNQFDFKELGRDVAPFLFNANDIKKVTLFPEYIQSVSL